MFAGGFMWYYVTVVVLQQSYLEQCFSLHVSSIQIALNGEVECDVSLKLLGSDLSPEFVRVYVSSGRSRGLVHVVQVLGIEQKYLLNEWQVSTCSFNEVDSCVVRREESQQDTIWLSECFSRVWFDATMEERRIAARNLTLVCDFTLDARTFPDPRQRSFLFAPAVTCLPTWLGQPGYSVLKLHLVSTEGSEPVK